MDKFPSKCKARCEARTGNRHSGFSTHTTSRKIKAVQMSMQSNDPNCSCGLLLVLLCLANATTCLWHRADRMCLRGRGSCVHDRFCPGPACRSNHAATALVMVQVNASRGAFTLVIFILDLNCLLLPLLEPPVPDVPRSARPSGWCQPS